MMMGRAVRSSLCAVTLLGIGATAHAQEAFVGITAHGVDTPFTLSTEESGADVQVGYRGAPIEALGVIGKPSPYVVASIHLKGDTHVLASGLSWHIGKRDRDARGVYFRPGVGLAVHTGPSYRVSASGVRTDLGSRILFEPEIALGYRLSRRAAIEASWIHISHAQLFGGQNPGLDLIGARMVWRTH